MSKIIVHIDLNAFFATCEQIKHPEFVGKPVIVAGLGGRGVVSTASYEARSYGVHSAMPTYQARELCPGGIFVEGDYQYYEMMSRSFFSYIRSFTSLVEEASIDECFADMSKALAKEKDPYAFFKRVQDGLYSQMGLKCSIGVAPNKFLAKMGSDMKKPMGITIVRKKDIPFLIYPLPIESFFGIGKRTSPKLREMGINTIGDLAEKLKVDDPSLQETLGKFYFTVKDWCFGNGSDVIDTLPFDPKSIGHSITFPSDTDDYEEIKQEISLLSHEVSDGANQCHKKGRTVQLAVKDSSFHTHDKSISFKDLTSDYSVIFQKATDLFEHNFLGMTIRLVGVTLQNLVDPKEETVQMSFWNFGDYEKMDETKLLVNELNRKMKTPSLKLANEVKKKNGSK